MESAWTRCKDVHVDGSGGGPTANVELRRCRWAAVALHDRTDSSAAYMVGLLSGVKQKVPRRELMNVIYLAEKMEGRDANREGVIYTDYVYVWSRCVKTDTRSAETSSNADLWERFRRERARVQREIGVIMVPAQTEIQDVSSERITQRRWCGN